MKMKVTHNYRDIEHNERIGGLIAKAISYRQS